MKRLRRKTITFEILTRASAPLQLSENDLGALIDGLEKAFEENVDLRYHPDGNRHLEDRHEFIGVDIVEAAA